MAFYFNTAEGCKSVSIPFSESGRINETLKWAAKLQTLLKGLGPDRQGFVMGCNFVTDAANQVCALFAIAQRSRAARMQLAVLDIPALVLEQTPWKILDSSSIVKGGCQYKDILIQAMMGSNDLVSWARPNDGGRMIRALLRTYVDPTSAEDLAVRLKIGDLLNGTAYPLSWAPLITEAMRQANELIPQQGSKTTAALHKVTAEVEGNVQARQAEVAFRAAEQGLATLPPDTLLPPPPAARARLRPTRAPLYAAMLSLGLMGVGIFGMTRLRRRRQRQLLPQ